MSLYTIRRDSIEIDPETISYQQLDCLFLRPRDGDHPAEAEPTGPAAADAAWWAEHAPRPDDDDGWLWELGPDPEPDYAVLMGERWTLAPSGWPTDEDCCPGKIG